MKKTATLDLIMDKDTDEQTLFEEWIHLWGGAVSEAALDPACNFFRTPHINGLIGYRLVGNCAIVFGDPICASNDTPALTQAFHQHCEERNQNIIYIIASEKFAKWALDKYCRVMLEVGEELVFNPQVDPKEGRKGNRLRNKLSHARNQGLVVHEYLYDDKEIENSIQQVGVEWLKARRGPQIYLGHLNFFDNRNDKRWFYVSNGDQVIASALLSKLKAKEGWLLKFLVTMPNAPRGTSELLMNGILETLRKEDCRFLTYGMVPADHLGEIRGLSQFKCWLARRSFKIAKWFFHLDQRKTYWQKFRPNAEKSYILFSNPTVGISEVRALIKALKVNL